MAGDMPVVVGGMDDKLIRPPPTGTSAVVDSGGLRQALLYIRSSSTVSVM